MQDRHPNLRYRRGEQWLDCYLRDRLIAQASRFKDGRWMLVRGIPINPRQSVHADYEAMFAELVPWARAHAWKHDRWPLGSVTAKGLRRRPT